MDVAAALEVNASAVVSCSSDGGLDRSGGRRLGDGRFQSGKIFGRLRPPVDTKGVVEPTFKVTEICLIKCGMVFYKKN